MAATQVARNPSFTGFEDLVKMPCSPTLQPRTRAASNAAPAAAAAAPSVASTSSAPAAFNMRKVGLDENQPPPPVGSSPEVFFRYYLAVELRKAGTQPSEALLDRYVRNHFDSLFKNKNGASPAAPAAPPSSSASAAHASSTSAQPRASTSQVTVAAVARPPPPQPKLAPQQPAPAVSPVAASTKHTASPPEFDSAESPALSGCSYSPIATPPALNSIGEDDALVDFSSVFGEPGSSLLEAPAHVLGADGIKFEHDTHHMLGFFRHSPFRTTHFESATIDPHVVETGGSALMQPPFAMALASITPSDLAAQGQTVGLSDSHSGRRDDDAPMSEDDMSEDDEHVHDSRQGSPSKSSGGKPLSTIPMAVGDVNYLKPDPEEYKKLSSKEKRQLRNKISARNFRTRRKEYITQLEEQIADRDAIIEGLRQQISQLAVENRGLKDEVKTIKAKTISSHDVGKILDALQSITTSSSGGAGNLAGVVSGRTSPSQELPLTPALLNFGDASCSSSLSSWSRPGTPTMAVPGSPRAQSPRPSLLRRSSPSLLPQPNTKKDVAPSSSFWGGVGAGSAFMPVC